MGREGAEVGADPRGVGPIEFECRGRVERLEHDQANAIVAHGCGLLSLSNAVGNPGNKQHKDEHGSTKEVRPVKESARAIVLAGLD